MEKISDSAKFTEVYHLIMKSAEIFARLSPNIPKALLEVVQRIHGSLDETAYHVFKASNTYDVREKLMHLETAQSDVFYLYNRIESDTSVIWLGDKPSYRQKLILSEE